MIQAENCPQCGAPLPIHPEERFNCPYCGATLYRQPSGSAPGSRGGGGCASAYGMAFRRLVYTDPGTGMDAFELMVPAGWESQGGIFWGMQNPAMPAVLSFRVFNPSGTEALEFLPAQSFSWTNEPMARMMFPPGSNYLGREVRQPGPALQVLQELIVPRARGQAAGLRVVAQEHLPQLARQMRANNPYAQAGGTESDGGRVRICYQMNGSILEEDLCAVVETQRMQAPGMWGLIEMVAWSADYLVCTRAAQGQLDRLANLYNTMVRSFLINPHWFNCYLQISNGLVQGQIRSIQQVGELSRQISRNNQQISDMIMSSWNERQQVYDRLSSNFSQAIRGVQQYHDPYRGYGVELPGGYRQAWTNGLGEYVVSDNPNFNPNIGSNQSWQEMNQA